MAFLARNLTCIAQGNGHKRWHYRTADALTAVRVAGYFNTFAKQMSIGDYVEVDVVTAPDAPTAITSKNMCFVNANSGTVVDVTDGMVMTATDSD
jgi:hypothetical protein|tara:strand:+ start:5281 stop:5565 length:285 start_codon:yes stop_codon:yes gene_type:complete